MDAPGTEGRREYNRSTLLFGVAIVLLATAIALILPMRRGGLDAIPPWLFGLGLYVVTPLSAILWVLSFQAIRRRPVLAWISVPAAYLYGFLLFITLLVNVGGVDP